MRVILQFHDCELDLNRVMLRRGGEEVRIEPQVFDLLSFLVGRRGEVVRKEELLDEVWGDRFVSESALTTRMKLVRHAVGDDGTRQAVIRTVHGKGYEFVAEVTVVDAGVATELADAPGLVRAGIRKGTRNAAVEDALTSDEVGRALAFGAGLAVEAVASGAKVIALGEMGIGNTSAATLVAHSVAGVDLGVLTGPGAGLDAHGVDRKLGVLARAAARRPGPLEAVDALAAFGGLEIAAMAGALIGAASAGAVVLVDGFIATAAALAALAARPEAKPYCVFAHRSKEPGHVRMLEWLGVEPLIDLDLRLGEGTGALLALPLLRAACAMLNEMATFETAQVSEKNSGSGEEGPPSLWLWACRNHLHAISTNLFFTFLKTKMKVGVGRCSITCL